MQQLQVDRDHILTEFHRHSQAYQTHIAGLRAELARIGQAAAASSSSSQPTRATPTASSTSVAETPSSQRTVNGLGETGGDGHQTDAAACSNCHHLQHGVQQMNTTLETLQVSKCLVRGEAVALLGGGGGVQLPSVSHVGYVPVSDYSGG